MKKAVPTAARVNLMFRAFSDRTRFRILALLQDCECCVGDLAQILGIEQPSASRHLAYLRRSGLVVVRKVCQWSYYSLAPARATFHRKLLECLAFCFQEVPEIERDRKKAQRLREGGGCCPPGESAKPSESRQANDAAECHPPC
jgi:ArsR family transcriptional regulator